MNLARYYSDGTNLLEVADVHGGDGGVPDGQKYIDFGWAQAEQNARGLWECLLLSGADVSDFAYETRTDEGREAGFWEFARRGSVEEVVEAVRQLRQEYDEACDAAIREMAQTGAEAAVDEGVRRMEAEEELASLRREIESLDDRLCDIVVDVHRAITVDAHPERSLRRIKARLEGAIDLIRPLSADAGQGDGDE